MDFKTIIEDTFAFLVKDYKLSYKCQRFENCFNGHWIVETYSYYNESGCFTFEHVLQRGEIGYYYAPAISNNREHLTLQELDIGLIGTDIWKKAKKKVFFEYRFRLVMETFKKAIKEEVTKKGEFFGIRVSKI